jgi:branched-chain amino acid aminotransferase group I
MESNLERGCRILEEMIYLNGHLLPRAQAMISPFDHGFLYGYGLYETMRAYSGRVFRLDRHLARLTRAAEMLGLASGVAQYDLEKAVYQTLAANSLRDARVRLTISAGEGDMIPDPSTCTSPTVLIMVRNLAPQPAQVYEKGFQAGVSKIRQNSQSPLSQIKSANHLNHILARGEARRGGADDALLSNEKGFLAEASTSNVFLVSKGTLITPSLESGALAGITRQAVMELASALDIDTREESSLTVDDLLQADEAFLTNSIMEIMPLTGVNGQPVGLGNPGPITQTLITGYKALVAKEIANRMSL